MRFGFVGELLLIVSFVGHSFVGRMLVAPLLATDFTVAKLTKSAPFVPIFANYKSSNRFYMLPVHAISRS